MKLLLTAQDVGMERYSPDEIAVVMKNNNIANDESIREFALTVHQILGSGRKLSSDAENFQNRL